MNKYILITFILTIGLFTACSKSEDKGLLDAVPKDVVLLAVADSPADLLETLSSSSDSTFDYQILGLSLRYLDSLSSLEPKMRRKLREAQVAFVKVSFGGKLNDALIFVSDKNLSNRKLTNAIESIGLRYEVHRYLEMDYLSLPGLDSACAFADGRFLVFAENEKLLSAVIGQIRSTESISDNTDFQRAWSTLCSSIPVHLYLDYHRLCQIVLPNVSSQQKESFERIMQGFNGIAALDVLPKPEGMLLNGYSFPSDSTSIMLPFESQMPVPNSMFDLLPSHTRLMLHSGMSDYASFWTEFVDHEKVGMLSRRYGVDLEEQLVRCVSEVAYCEVGSSAQAVFVGRLNRPAVVEKTMKTIEAQVGIVENIVVGGYSLKKLNVNNFISDVFGSWFNTLGYCCYSIVDQYLVMANDFKVIQDVISSRLSGRTLASTGNFKPFQDYLLEAANLSFYVNLAEYQRYENDMKKMGLGGLLQGNASFLMQMAACNDLVYTCFAFQHDTESENTFCETGLQWKTVLDAPVKGKPYIVATGDSKHEIVAFDTDNSMYLIDCYGNIIWKTRLDEAPLSAVELVDYDKNGRLQFLFNTAHYLHLVGHDGTNVDGFPKRLLCEASNGLSVFDYDGNRQYRVMICGTDSCVYNYDLHGTETHGWNRPRTEALVKEPVQHVVADNKDFILVTDVEGSFRIFDRQGRIRIPLKSELKKSQNAVFYENRTNHKGIMLTSDNEGRLLYVAFDGSSACTDFGSFSVRHSFLYEDFDGDKDPDFIYLDGSKLQVFNRFKKVLCCHDFEVEADTMPVFYRWSKNKCLLGAVSGKSRMVFLVDGNGMPVGTGWACETGVAIGSLKDDEVNLLTGVGNSLYNYLVY